MPQSSVPQEECPGIYFRVMWGWEYPLEGQPKKSLFSISSSDKIPTLQYVRCPILRRTPKGVWISDPLDQAGRSERFCLTDAWRSYAYPTLAQAITSFIKRREKFKARMLRQLEQSESLLEQAKAPDVEAILHARDAQPFSPFGD